MNIKLINSKSSFLNFSQLESMFRSAYLLHSRYINRLKHSFLQLQKFPLLSDLPIVLYLISRAFLHCTPASTSKYKRKTVYLKICCYYYYFPYSCLIFYLLFILFYFTRFSYSLFIL